MSVKVYQEPRLRKPRLLVSWSPDVADLGWGATGYLKQAIEARECGEVEPTGFFNLSGVAIEQDVVKFPTSKLFFSPGYDVLIFESVQPQRKLYHFLNLLLDLAQSFNVKQIYTIGGMASGIAHSAKRRMFTVVNRPGLRGDLTKRGLQTDMFYQGQPSISSFLLWAARNRGLDGISLWQEVAFYLAAAGDWRSTMTTVEFLNTLLKLKINLDGLKDQATGQENLLQRLRQQRSEVDSAIKHLEGGAELTEDEVQKLAGEVSEFLGK